MPAAYLPSPARSVWHLGSFGLGGYALAMVAAVVAGLWLTDLRYRKSGGRPGTILDIATVTVPAGLVGARAYTVFTRYHLFFGAGRDWTNVLRIWDGGLGSAGAVAAGAVGAWAYCRLARIDVGPVALAAAPALAVSEAVSAWGNWFSQTFYGRPTTLPWAVAIAPEHRAAGYQAFATFQPVFAYESVLDLLIAVAIGYAIRRYSLTGDRALALEAVLYAAVRFCAEALRIDYSPRMLGLRTNQVAMVALLLAACSYLAVRHRRRRPAAPTRPPEPTGQAQLQH